MNKNVTDSWKSKKLNACADSVDQALFSAPSKSLGTRLLVSAVLSSVELEKKNKYTAAAESRRASFTPFVVSVDGVFGREATCFLKRVAERLSFIWNKPYSIVMGWVKVRLQFAILRAKVSRGNSEYRIIRNGSGIYLGYYKTTDRLDILFHHKVAAGVGFIISTSFAAGRCPSQRRAKKC